MGRMLKALQQVGTTPRSTQTIGPVSQQELESFGLWPLLEPRGELPEAQDAGGLEATASTAEASPVSLLHAAEETVAAELHRGESPRSHQADPIPGRSTCSPQSEYQELSERILAQASSRPSAALMFAGVDEQSPAATMLAELAVVMAARTSGDVLLIDADFDRPQLADRFGVAAEWSLPDVFLGLAHWQHVIRRTDTPHLSLLPGGRWPVNQHLAEDFEPGHLLSQIQQSHSLVLVHAAATARPEAVWLGRHTDGVYLVVELGRTSRWAARRAFARLERCGVRPLGCVVTDAVPSGRSGTVGRRFSSLGGWPTS